MNKDKWTERVTTWTRPPNRSDKGGKTKREMDRRDKQNGWKGLDKYGNIKIA